MVQRHCCWPSRREVARVSLVERRVSMVWPEACGRPGAVFAYSSRYSSPSDTGRVSIATMDSELEAGTAYLSTLHVVAEPRDAQFLPSTRARILPLVVLLLTLRCSHPSSVVIERRRTWCCRDAYGRGVWALQAMVSVTWGSVAIASRRACQLCSARRDHVGRKWCLLTCGCLWFGEARQER